MTLIPNMNYFITNFLLYVVPISFGAYAPDQVIKLPGWDLPLPSRQYSGYLNINNNDKHLHYWLIESESPTQATDPVVIWFNGGPGCSSLDGFFYEHGPFEIADNGNDLTLRKYRWSRLANILYIEQPAGVGFSYSDSKQYRHNDDSSSLDNLAAVEKFYELFPEYKTNQFFISGESYAGIYVPMLAYQILRAGTSYTGAKLTGIMVGNGCTGTEVGICANYFYDICEGTYYATQYLNGLAFTNPAVRDAINADCDWNACLRTGAKNSVLSKQCVNLINRQSLEMGQINIYNVYGTCKFDSCEGPRENPFTGRLGPQSSSSPLLRNNRYSFINYAATSSAAAAAAAGGAAVSTSVSTVSTTSMEVSVADVSDTPLMSESEQNGVYDAIYTQVYGPEFVKNKKQYFLEKQQQQLQESFLVQYDAIEGQNIAATTAATLSGAATASDTTTAAAAAAAATAAANVDMSVEMELETSVSTNDDILKYNKYYAYGPAGCIDSRTASTYLMKPAVMAAIHVRDPGYCWAVCNQAKGFTYTQNQPNLPRDVYPTLIANIRVLIFNGDWDACVPVTDNLAWTEKMAAALKLTTTKPWHPWAYTLASDATTQIGGYSVKYDVKSYGNGSFEFRTVRGAGHMVPGDAPEQGLAVLGHLLSKNFDTEDTYQMPNLTATACGMIANTLRGEQAVVISVSILFGLILVVIIGLLGYRVHTLQKHSRASRDVVDFDSFPGPGSSGGRDSSDRDNVRLTSMPYVAVYKQDEAVI